MEKSRTAAKWKDTIFVKGARKNILAHGALNPDKIPIKHQIGVTDGFDALYS